MSHYTVKLARFVRDILDQPEFAVVQIGRQNLRRDNFSDLQIIIDSLGAAKRLNASEKYDGNTELMTFAQQYSAPCTVNFYGDDAGTMAEKFALLAQSQKGYELQLLHKIAVFNVSSITDLKLLASEQYSQRFEVALQVQYTISADVEMLRIDTAQTKTITDRENYYG
ncbi:MAG: hypothetical protein IBX55_08835 [Methyloprofundus sp.]|nr:hypothetical protein [Methyloprofundus sp.]